MRSTNTSQPNAKNKKRSKHKNVVVLVVNDSNAINARIEERLLVLNAARDAIEDTDVSVRGNLILSLTRRVMRTAEEIKSRRLRHRETRRERVIIMMMQ